MKNISRRCPNCFGETKVFLVDLNAYNGRTKIKFKRCKWKKMKKKKKLLYDIIAGQNRH